MMCGESLMSTLRLDLFGGILLLCIPPGLAFGQSGSLALSSGSTIPGGTVSLSLTLTSPSGSQPAGLQWTLTYSPAAVIAITASRGPVAGAAGKSITCVGSPGAYQCILIGLDTTVMQNGVAAVVRVTVAANVPSAAIGITNALGTSATATAIPVTATGGTILTTSSFSLTCNPTMLGTGMSSTCTVALAQAAPSGGIAISLSSNNKALTVPASVTVAGGKSSATFTASAGTVTYSQYATVTATWAGISQQATFLLAPTLVISSLGCTPTSLASGASSTCTVTLSRKSLNGATVRLTDNNALLFVPPSVTVPASSKTATFTATAGTIPSSQTAVITATYLSSIQTAALSLTPLATKTNMLTSISCDQPSLVGGASVGCSVQLAQAAPAGGAMVGLTASQASLGVPGAVPIAEGSSVGRFTLTTRPSDQDETGTVTAGTATSQVRTTVTTLALKPASLDCAPGDAGASEKLLCELHLNAVIDQSVSLAVSGSANVKLPAALTTRPRQSSLTFEAQVAPLMTARSVSIRVGFGANAVEQSLPAPAASAPTLVLPEAVLARAGQPTEFTVSSPDASQQPIRLSVSQLPSAAAFDAASGRFTWTPASSQQGSYEPVFTAAGVSGNSSSGRVRIDVGSGAPVATALLNAAGQAVDPVCSPGAVAGLLGKWLDNTASPATNSLPVVTANGMPLQVLSASPTRVEFRCPQLVPGAMAGIALRTAAGQTAPLQTTLRSAAPAIFTLDNSNQGLILFDRADPSDEVSLAAVRSYRAAGQPAQPGDCVSIRATGFEPDAPIVARIGDVLAPAVSLTPVRDLPGAFDVRVTVPSGVPVGDAVPVLLEVTGPSGKSFRSNIATMAIELPRP
jgi:uncharacterized protein (TIGR03437 family)